ncbi:MAG: phosphomethylpyrimidine synthase ThiC, partial [Planctomycetes bacterium]|nr:phosphomethylpyrimidine synthase ThiC [Planctomycetota bacterium]
MSLIELARAGEIPELVRRTAEIEQVTPEFLLERLLDGTATIPCANRNQLAKPCAVGRDLRVKVNANIGTSMDVCDLDKELEKLRVAIAAGADAMMDLSTGSNPREVRAAIRENCPVPLGSVPIYEVIANCVREKRNGKGITATEMLEAVRLHAEDGIDFVTVHCGLTKRCVELLRQHRRTAGVVSRGGSVLANWIVNTGNENPYYEQFDELLALAKEYELTISLGDGVRPGCLADAGDHAQIEELYTLGELVLRAREADVQVIVEGPGHVPLHEIKAQIELQKTACHGAPFYVLGP